MNGEKKFDHIPVLLKQTVDGLAVKSDGTYLDGTVGGGGHSEEIAKRLSENGRLICLDQDEEAIEAAKERLKPFSDRVTIIKSNFAEIKKVAAEQKIKGFDGILIDIGVSSHQLDTAGRGFSYLKDAPLDMRMDRSAPLTAKDVVNTYPEEELFRIIKDYGEERFAKNIAKRICEERKKAPIETTLQLAAIPAKVIPAKYREKHTNPAMRTFQAIRIEVNDELSILERALEEMTGLLNDKGRLAVITFHSLEDRIVKNAFRTAENPCTCPPQFPVCVCGKKSRGAVITKKPVTPGKEETERNSRAHSAKLRIFERRKA